LQVHVLMRDSMKMYHKEWNVVFEKQSEAAELLATVPAMLMRAGLCTPKLQGMTALIRRTFAREVRINHLHTCIHCMYTKFSYVYMHMGTQIQDYLSNSRSTNALSTTRPLRTPWYVCLDSMRTDQK
jgi:hypothetical protein